MVIAGGRIAWLLFEGERRLYEFTFWLFTYVFMGMAPLVQIRTGDTPVTTPGIDRSSYSLAFTIVLIGIVMAGAGTLVARGHRSANVALEIRQISARRARQLLGASALITTYFLARIGIASLFGSRESAQAKINSVWPNSTVAAIVLPLATMPLLVSFVALCGARRQHQRVGVPALAACGAALLVLVNPISSPRFAFGTVVLSMAAAVGAVKTPSRFRGMCVTTAVALVLIFPYADIARYSTSRAGTLSRGGPLHTLTGGDFDAFAQIVNTITYVHEHGFTNGRQAIGVLLFWVPRSLWTGKPIDTGVLLAKDRGYPFTNLSAPLWSEFFINGGWPLLVLGMFALGYLLRRADDRAASVVGGTATVLGGIAPFYLLILLRGSLLAATAYLVVIAVAARFVMVRRKHPTATRRSSIDVPAGQSVWR